MDSRQLDSTQTISTSANYTPQTFAAEKSLNFLLEFHGKTETKTFPPHRDFYRRHTLQRI